MTQAGVAAAAAAAAETTQPAIPSTSRDSRYLIGRYFLCPWKSKQLDPEYSGTSLPTLVSCELEKVDTKPLGQAAESLL
ncbi:hypothetical protein MJG53_006549 [Ovis ammon polii x Ovis aries]|uniref:Uncharacterized protein n=1 Tax=Ovis ammon polii x Ovis aries TaxID=2918886 RepID=A0ACB9V6G0_9CETA|nr:hypothetical protein MJG53_006549 [Ovis ammon polii x Ovis aries]